MVSYPFLLTSSRRRQNCTLHLGVCAVVLNFNPKQIIFDECHKAKNATSTKMGKAVLDLQNQLPRARVVYASATGRLTAHACNTTYDVMQCDWGFNLFLFFFFKFNLCPRCLWAKEHDLHEPSGNLGWRHTLQSLWWLPTCNREEVCSIMHQSIVYLETIPVI